MRRHVSDLGNDQIDDLMRLLVVNGLATWIREPSEAPSGRRSYGSIRATWEGRERLEAAIKAEREANSVGGRVKGCGAAAVRWVQSAGGLATALTAIIGLLALIGFRGCSNL